MRAFISINFNEAVIRRLIKAQDELRFYDKYANYSRRENLHLTLAFIGETDRCDDIVRIMNQCTVKPFTLTVSGCGSFGNDIFWAGIKKDPTLENLAISLQDALRSEGFQIEKRRFSPHITLARQMRDASSVHIKIPEISMEVDSFSLMESSRIRGKLVYTEISRVKLK
ncbi:MAG: RNA 2',3'-cyclic phosphodiesterase [Clostridia bacterium]|nr:RNA 2',3'-cyclic phosphodiesterase [Clostridia bacterium]